MLQNDFLLHPLKILQRLKEPYTNIPETLVVSEQSFLYPVLLIACKLTGFDQMVFFAGITE